MQISNNKKKIINDPVYGFVKIPSDLIYDLIEHPYFQRLRRIKQLGLSNLVYPGALHTRFQHVIGAMGLTVQSIDILRTKGIEITEEEKEAVCAAVLLHDMGHGPYSHALEKVIIQNVDHETISLAFMQKINDELNGRLDLCVLIFKNEYHKKFLHQLVSSQLDMDRIDYLRRDSFYTGVQEGVIGHDRIINMLNVCDDEMVIDEKGIYSIEKFLIARRLMYWQVYLHKTVIAAETLLLKIFLRASELAQKNAALFATPAFHYFLYNKTDNEKFVTDSNILELYSQLDDFDIFTSIKVWCKHEDKVLRELCLMMRDRKLPSIEIQNGEFETSRIDKLKTKISTEKNISINDATYFVFSDNVKNEAYNLDGFNIKVLYKNGKTLDIAEASDLGNILALSETVTKYFLCYPKNV